MNAIINPHRRPWAALLPPENRWRLPDTATTMAEALAEAGYTSSIIGQVEPRLRGARPRRRPRLRRCARRRRGAGPRPTATAVARFAEENPHKATGPITLQAIRFIEREREGPFFCFVSFFAPHIKSEAREELVRKYERKKAAHETLILPRYAAMVEAMDEGVGLLLGALDSLGLAGNTLVVFTSDNGGLIQVYHHAWPPRDDERAAPGREGDALRRRHAGADDRPPGRGRVEPGRTTDVPGYLERPLPDLPRRRRPRRTSLRRRFADAVAAKRRTKTKDALLATTRSTTTPPRRRRSARGTSS